MEPIFFASPEELRDWFAEHADSADELYVGFYKKASGLGGLGWSQAVDEALCVGWIDSVMIPIDEIRRAQRFSPRRKRSIWSLVNVRKVAQLTEEGRMKPAGLAAFQARTDARTAVYSHEQSTEPALEDASELAFRANGPAWTFFLAQAPSYRRAVIHWIRSAKKAETRERRLRALIAESAASRRVAQFAPRKQ